MHLYPLDGAKISLLSDTPVTLFGWNRVELVIGTEDMRLILPP
ncbi:MAG: hypothetical protein ACEPO2_11835 [Pelagibaca sp.]